MKLAGRVVALAAATLVLASSLQSQDTEVVGTIASAAHVQSFSFGPAGDASTARLFLVPVSFQRALGSRMALDGYAAYGVGRVQIGNKAFSLAGPVDSWLRLRLAFNEAVVVAAGLALPTGVERHNSGQSVVASVLSNDLLGFREATWGSGGSATFGISAARRTGVWKATSGASYKLAKPFQPSTDTSVSYAPGNEAKVRFGLERSMRTGAVFAGVTAQHLGVDKADDRNLFRPGARVRADLNYTAANWSVFVSDLWRAQGDLTLPIVNLLDGSFLRDSAFVVGSQNLVILGASRTIALSNTLLMVPTGEFKIRTRDERVGRGWLGAAGVAVPFNAGSAEFFPSAKVSLGRVSYAADPASTKMFWGAEFSFVVRHSWRRLRPAAPAG